MSFSLALYLEPKAHQPARLAGEGAPSLLLGPLLRRARITDSHQPPQPLLWGPGICTQVCMPVQQALYTLPPEPSPQPTNVNCSGTSLADQRLQPDSGVSKGPGSSFPCVPIILPVFVSCLKNKTQSLTASSHPSLGLLLSKHKPCAPRAPVKTSLPLQAGPRGDSSSATAAHSNTPIHGEMISWASYNLTCPHC